MTPDVEYRWASESGAHSMASVEELEWLGYAPVIRNGAVVRDPRYPVVLMHRPARA